MYYLCSLIKPKSVISVMMIITLFLHRCFAALRVTDLG